MFCDNCKMFALLVPSGQTSSRWKPSQNYISFKLQLLSHVQVKFWILPHYSGDSGPQDKNEVRFPERGHRKQWD